MNSLHELDHAIDRWLGEDIGDGDHTTLSTILPGAKGSANIEVKEPGIIAGISVAERIFHRFDRELEVRTRITDGTYAKAGDVPIHLSGRIHSILQCERLVLNILQRMSGIATSTHSYVRLLDGTRARIMDTRKTTPGLRMLEKEAVRLGGGMNHRTGLFDMILIKDNHVDFAGGISPAVKSALAYLEKHSLDLPIEVETRSLEDVEEVLRVGGIHRIMLDNFTLEETRRAVELIDNRYETESSGGITRETIRAFAECGVDFISVGALTNQINSLDISCKADF